MKRITIEARDKMRTRLARTEQRDAEFLASLSMSRARRARAAMRAQKAKAEFFDG